MSTVTVAELHRSPSPADRVAARIRGLAGEQGLKQRDLAKALGLGESQISGRLRGRIAFTINEIYILAELFDIEPGELLPKCAVRDLNPEPAGLASADLLSWGFGAESDVAEGAQLAVVIPLRRPKGPGTGRPAEKPHGPLGPFQPAKAPFRIDCATG
jgi:transcriptional regulator with XRE-family HTH domain